VQNINPPLKVFPENTGYVLLLWTARRKRTCGSYEMIACDAGYEAITNTRRVKDETEYKYCSSESHLCHLLFRLSWEGWEERRGGLSGAMRIATRRG
jgi:hypothetical protein